MRVTQFAKWILALSSLTVCLHGFGQSAGDFRSIISSNWSGLSTWERFDGSVWVGGFFPTNSDAGVITIRSGHIVTNATSMTADQIIVVAGGTLASINTLNITNGTGVDLEVFGTLLALIGATGFTLQSGSDLTVQSGGVFVHDGSGSACVNNLGGTVTFQSGGKFLQRRQGGTIPTATWNPGSTLEVNYPSANLSRPFPGSLGQPFHHFYFNNINQSGDVEMNNALTNIFGDLTINSGTTANLHEFRLCNTSGSGSAFYNGDITVNAGRFNWASGGGPYVWALRGDLIVNAGTAMDLSGTISGSYTLLIDGFGEQNYVCAGNNLATNLNWTINTNSTLNLSNDLALTAAGRTLTANGVVTLNGKTLSTDLVAGSGVIRNKGGGSGKLVLGASDGANTLDGALTLSDGASGTLGLVKVGTNVLTITSALFFGGGLFVSNGTVLVNNTNGTGTGPGAVAVYGGTLGGTGFMRGPVTIHSSGTLAAGNSLGTLTINSNLTLAGILFAELDKSVSPSNDLVVVSGTITNVGTGTITITNLGPSLTPGDKFKLFSQAVQNGGALTITGGDVSWINDLATDGSITVAAASVSPPILNYTNFGNSAQFSWTNPAYKLVAQTNPIGTGINVDTNAWYDYPGGVTSPVTAPIDSGQGSVFFRLFKP